MSMRLPMVQTLADATAAEPRAQIAIYVLGTLVLAAAVGAAVWAGQRVRAEAKRGITDPTPDVGPSELSSRHVFRLLQERKIASVEELAAMSPRERQLLFDAVATKVTPVLGIAAVQAGGRHRGSEEAGEHPPIGALHCPACGAALAAGPDAPRVVTTCAGCGRRVAARRDGGRVSVTVDDRRDSGAVNSVPPRPPQRPSGGSPTTRARS